MQFLGNGSSVDTIVRPDGVDNRMRPAWFVIADVFVRPDAFDLLDGLSTGWWPGAAGLSTDAGGVLGDILNPIKREPPEYISGQSTRWGITGIARDVYGSPLANVELTLFKTDDDTKQDQKFSDAFGGYTLTTPYYQAHYIVAYKTGSPDITGTSVNTLIPGT
jgi:hypothetical protein